MRTAVGAYSGLFKSIVPTNENQLKHSLTQVFVFFQTLNWRASTCEFSNKHLLNPVCLPSNLSEIREKSSQANQLKIGMKIVNLYLSHLSTANGAQTPLSCRVKHTWSILTPNPHIVDRPFWYVSGQIPYLSSNFKFNKDLLLSSWTIRPLVRHAADLH